MAFVLALLLAGCGGGGGGGTSGPVTVNRSIQITWPVRSRAGLVAPASALSAEITIVAGDSSGHDIVFTVNRGNRTDAYTATYPIPTSLSSSANRLTARFFAQVNGLGDVVATAQSGFNLGDSNLNLTSVVLDGKVSTVTVAPRTLSVNSGATQLTFTAADSTNHPIAVSPGSAVWALVSGASVVSLTPDGRVTPLTVGTATVTATVDGVSSVAATITVNSSFTRVFRFSRPTDTIQLKGGELNGACTLGTRFTVEAIVKPAQADSRRFIWQQWTDSDMNEIFILDPDRFFMMGTGAGEPEHYYYGDAFPLNQWSHMAWCSDGTQVRIYRNGNLISTTPVSGRITPLANAEAAAIGKNCGVPFVTQDFAFVGDLAAFRISSVDRYTGNTYEVPTGPWTLDESTQMLVDPSTISGTPTTFAIPGSQHLTGTLAGGSSSATAPAWVPYVP